MKQPTLRIGLIGGSGLGDALAGESGEQVYPDTPFGKPSSPITLTKWADVEIAILQRHGIGHTFNPSAVPYRANIFALKELGCTHLLCSGATGSLREDMHPGEIVIVDQFIDKTYRRANTFFEQAAVHVELAEPCCPTMRTWLIESAAAMPEIKLHDGGTYVCMEGPAFSTKAESEMHRQWGGDLIGMTAMPEAKLAREAELPYALIAMPTDYDCWKAPDPGKPHQQLLEEIIGNLKQASTNAIELIKHALRDVSALETESSAASALQLGIWSDKSKISQEEVERLAPLWGKYF